MIKVDSDNQVIVTDGDELFAISASSDDYKKFVMHITNPDPQFEFDEEMLLVDEGLDEGSDEYALAMRYAVFLQGFMEKREEAIEAHKDEIEIGGRAIDEAAEALEEIANQFEDEG